MTLTDAAANAVRHEAAPALVLGVAAKRAQSVVANKVWSAVVGAQSALIDVWSKRAVA